MSSSTAGPQDPAPDSIAGLLMKKLDQARLQLIDRNLRNKLVNCGLTSKRAKQIHVIDERSDEVFRHLLGQKRSFTFAAGRGLDSEDQDEQDTDVAVWVPPEDGNGAGPAARHTDDTLQTQLTREGLQKRLTGLYYESIESEEEQGINILYLALGFLKWYEDQRSEVARYAPLILLPVELTRSGAKEKFRLKARDEDLITNRSLAVWLEEQHSIKLPEIPESDEWIPTTYFQSVRRAIRDAARWEVLDNEILLGFFSFSKFLLWRDLDTTNWPAGSSLLEHSVLRQLLAPQEENPLPDVPVIPADKRIDDIFKARDLTYVLDADSSQTEAIQTALAGRNLVVQGPPGTGKSQTIANVIAASVHQGKTVLFVAEKMAALEVVFQRLKDAGLGPLCLELHSRKAAKTQVLAQLRDALNAPVPPNVSGRLFDDLDKCIDDLNTYVDRLHEVHTPSGQSAYQVIGRLSRLRDVGVPPPDFKIAGATKLDSDAIRKILENVSDLAERISIAGLPGSHPWRGSNREAISPLDMTRLDAITEAAAKSFESLERAVKFIWSLVKPESDPDYAGLSIDATRIICDALRVVAKRPDVPLNDLTSDAWPSRLGELESLVETSLAWKSTTDVAREVFIEAAWSQEWTEARSSIAAHGESLFRIFSSEYRKAFKQFKGFCKDAPPDTYQARVTAVDELVRSQSLSVDLGEKAETFKCFSSFIPKAAFEQPRLLAQMAAWLRSAAVFEPALKVRHAPLLSKSDKCDNWADTCLSRHADFAKTISELNEFVDESDTALRPATDVPHATFRGFRHRIAGWRGSSQLFNEWPPIRRGLARITELAGSTLAKNIADGSIPAAAIRNLTEASILEDVWRDVIAADPLLAELDGRTLDKLVKEFKSLDKSRISVASHQVARSYHDSRPTGSAGEMATIRQEVNKSRRLLATRKLMSVAGNAVQQLKPVFLMSPLSVAQYLQPGRLKFDLVLMDEASQIRPEDALGAIARGSQAVVVGDDKQLPPTNFFNRLVADDDYDPDDDDTSAPIGSMESILGLCDSVFSSKSMLRWHYRSQHPALIAVSNKSFYDNRLFLPPSVSTGVAADGLGVVFRRTPSGHYDRGRTATNMKEAEIVVDAVCDFARATPHLSLGVGTFSVAQRDVIRDLVDDRRRKDPTLEPFFGNSGTDSFFVKNLESIQGDERDVIFISIGYGRDRDGGWIRSFGPLSKDGGERRLNVLISRSKRRCEVFSSITAEDISLTNAKAGVVALRQFLQFAEKGYIDVPMPTSRGFDSDFEESVADFISRNGFRVHPQVGMAGFFIDIGVIDSANESKYVLGIECDGATYHSSRSARDRDRLRQQILESRGWKIYRVWSTDWFHRRQEEEAKLLAALDAARKPVAKEVFETEDQDDSVAGLDLPDHGAYLEERVDSSAEPLSVSYVEASFKVKRDDLPHQAPVAELADIVERIVSIEGPIHEEEVGRRLATVWGFNRAGGRIQAATKDALRYCQKKGKLRAEKKFWSLPGTDRPTVRDRASVLSSALRKPEYLPPEEIFSAAVSVVEECVRLSFEDLVVEVARRFGFQRTGSDLQTAIASAIRNRLGSNIQQADDGSVSSRPTEA